MQRGVCPSCRQKQVYSRGVVQTERCGKCHSVFYRGILLGKEPDDGLFVVELIRAGPLVMRGRDIDPALTERVRAQLKDQPHFIDPYGIEAAKQPLLNAEAWWRLLPEKDKVRVHQANGKSEGRP